jgi:hypothetical protein
MTIQDIYAKYQIMPQLSLHMRRVAAVGQLILEGWKGEIDRDLVMRTLLLHDMGNLAKFDLTEAGQQRIKSAEPTDLPHWREVQIAFWEEYGRSAHEATKAIVSKLGHEDVNDILEAEHTLFFSEESDSQLALELPATLILLYSDCRVIPTGVTTYDARLEDLNTRYGSKSSTWKAWMERFEQHLQSHTSTQLTAITEASTAPILDKLLNYTV